MFTTRTRDDIGVAMGHFMDALKAHEKYDLTQPPVVANLDKLDLA